MDQPCKKCDSVYEDTTEYYCPCDKFGSYNTIIKKMLKLKKDLEPFRIHAKQLRGHGWAKDCDLMHMVYKTHNSELQWGHFNKLLDKQG